MEFAYNDLLNKINVQTIIFGLTVLLSLLYLTKDLRRNLPPGPWSLPIVGIIPFMGKNPHQTLVEYSHRYGPVFSGYFGSSLVVFVNDYKSMRQMFAKSGDTFSDRPQFGIVDKITNGKGLAVGYLHRNLKEKRKFGLKILRSLGMGKASFESTIVTEVDYVISKLSEVAHESVAYNPQHILDNAVSNVTCGIVFGKRYEYDDPKFERNLSMLYAVFEILSQASSLNFLPFLRFIPGSGWNKIITNMEIFDKEFIEAEIKEHEQTLDVHNPRDFIDEFLKARYELENAGESIEAFDHESAIRVTADLIIGGTETTATTLKWALLYLVLHPDVQMKVHQELDSVIGRQRAPTLKDQHKLVYCEAVMMEVLRIRPAVALCLPHSTVNDTVYEGYFIPKDTTIIANIWAIMHDEITWCEPDKFKPERFIDEENKLIRSEELIPFSIGRRACLGEQLARTQLYLFFTHLLHHFRFGLPVDSLKPTTNPHLGITMTPKPYEIIINKRI